MIRRPFELGEEPRTSLGFFEVSAVDAHRDDWRQQRGEGDSGLCPVLLGQTVLARDHVVPVAQREERICETEE